MNITLDSLQKATQKLATENSKTEGLSGLEYLFADDIEKDDEVNLDPTPAKDEPEAKDDEDTTPVADALDDLKEVALDAAEDEVLTAGEVDLDDEDTVLDLSAGKKEDEKKDGDKDPVDEETAGPGVATQGNGDNADVGTDADKDVPVTEGEKIKVPCTCPMCKQTQDIEVDADAYDAWQGGELIQNAFPDLSPDEREALKTGICGKCWDEMFGGPEDFEDEDEYEEIAECKGCDKAKATADGNMIVEHDEKHCKTLKVNVYDIDWDVEDEKDLDQLPTSLDLEVHYCPGDDLDELVGDALAKEYRYANNGFNFEIVKGEETDECNDECIVDDEEPPAECNNTEHDAILVSEGDDCSECAPTGDTLAGECNADESALGDAFKSIGQGLKGILHSTLKGAAVLIAGLGGSFLFGLPGLLLAVCIAFGLMSAKECQKIQVDEGLSDIKNKLKTAIKIFKADPKKAKEINDKVMAAKKSGDKQAIQAAAAEVKALAGASDPKDPKGGKKPEGDEVQVTERAKASLDDRLREWAHVYVDLIDRALNEMKATEEAKEDAGDFDEKAPKFVSNILKFLAGAAVDFDPALVDQIIGWAVNGTGGVDDDEIFADKIAEYLGGHLERIWLSVDDEEEFADAADQMLRGLFVAVRAPKEGKAANLRRNAKLIETYIEVGGGSGLEVAERHGEFKRSKFKKDKWGDGRRGRPRPEDDEEEDDVDLDLIDDEDDTEYADVAEDDKVSLKDITADQVKAIADMDPKAREEMSKMKPEDREQAMAMLGIEVTEEDEDGEGKEDHTYTAYFEDSVPADPPAEGYSITTDEGDEYAVSLLTQITEFEAGDFPLGNVTKDGEDWYDEYSEILDKLMSEDRVYDYDYSPDDVEWIGMEDDDEEEEEDKDEDDEEEVDEDGDCCECDVTERHGEFRRPKFNKDKWSDGPRRKPRFDDEEDDYEDDYDEVDLTDDEVDAEDLGLVAEDIPDKQPEDPTDGKPEENIPPEYEVADECDGVAEDRCPDCGAEMREEPHTGNRRCPRCHHFEKGSYKPSIFETTDVSTSRQLQKFLKECNTFKKSPRLRKSVAKFTKMIHESPRKAQTLVNYLDRQFKGKPVSERRFCQAFVKAL